MLPIISRMPLWLPALSLRPHQMTAAEETGPSVAFSGLLRLDTCYRRASNTSLAHDARSNQRVPILTMLIIRLPTMNNCESLRPRDFLFHPVTVF